MTDNLSNNPNERIFSATALPEIGYERAPEIESQIEKCLRFSESELTARLASIEFRSEKYLKGETLVCLLGLARAENLTFVYDLIAAKLKRICDRLVRDFLRKRGFDENFSEEAVNELMVEMFVQILGRGTKSYDFWEVNFFNALERLTGNYLRKHGAKAKATHSFSELSSADGEEDFEFESTLQKFETLTIEEKLGIKEILGKMPAEHREIFRLYYVEEWTQEQIAEVCGVTARTVRNRLRVIEEFLKKFRGGEK